MRSKPQPSHFVGAAIMSTGVLVGLASIVVDIDVEPVDLDDVNALSARLTQRAHEQRDIPPNQRYMVLSWQRFGDARPMASAPIVGHDPVTHVPLCQHGDDAAACQLAHVPHRRSGSERTKATGWAGCDIPGHSGCTPMECRWAPVCCEHHSNRRSGSCDGACCDDCPDVTAPQSWSDDRHAGFVRAMHDSGIHTHCEERCLGTGSSATPGGAA